MGYQRALLKLLSIALLIGLSKGLFIKIESYDAVTHSTCGPAESYKTTEFIGCADTKTTPFTCNEEDDPFYGKRWIYSNVSFDKTTGIFSVNFGSCKEPTCTNSTQCTRETYLLASGNVKPGDILSGSNCSLSGSKQHGNFVRYSVVSGDTINKMVANPSPKTALLRSCFDNSTSSAKLSPYGASLCAEDWTMWPVHEQCFFQAKDAGSSKTTCEPAVQAVYMTQWTSSDSCQGPKFEEQYYRDQAKSCGLNGTGYYVEFCTD